MEEVQAFGGNNRHPREASGGYRFESARIHCRGNRQRVGYSQGQVQLVLDLERLRQ